MKIILKFPLHKTYFWSPLSDSLFLSWSWCHLISRCRLLSWYIQILEVLYWH